MEATLTKKDFESDQQVRWCPGCGDYAILAAMLKALPEMKQKREDIVFISGIGCASRFPYYVNSYGFHTIHGRAPAIATGVKLANPNLTVWEITGDGDSLAIGGNHFIHAIRRNIDINILLFNNEIYGLTKGQFSPTSHLGLVTKSSPTGSIDPPFNPASLAMGANCTFYARVPDTDLKLMGAVFKEAQDFKGTSVIEVLQNCVIFNDHVHAPVTDKTTKLDRQLILKHGEPMLYGENNSKGLMLKDFDLVEVVIGENGITIDDILVHDAKTENKAIHHLLMDRKEFPYPLGVIRAVENTTYDTRMHDIIKQDKATYPYENVQDLLESGKTWEVN